MTENVSGNGLENLPRIVSFGRSLPSLVQRTVITIFIIYVIIFVLCSNIRWIFLFWKKPLALNISLVADANISSFFLSWTGEEETKQGKEKMKTGCLTVQTIYIINTLLSYLRAFGDSGWACPKVFQLFLIVGQISLYSHLFHILEDLYFYPLTRLPFGSLIFLGTKEKF